ncbi:endonuclease domain-containing protein [Planktothrix agardhii]|uniref:endonuclease domain-containing protein n=1 Tax=Planktothrix agardhii TaxID=1160 RepID=UPI001F420651|nr:DUF559 domain-containing protein [Planktothrix agardhii]MCF3574663.1 endonuclease domain-containing protein [Planktothrix agardhii 1812]MCF3578168.1 endonuclease domain-containing protein [Planktothrix agardhii 1812]
MTELYNRNSEKEKRQFLRNNMTAIEVDGDSHFQEGVQEYDQERQQFIESARITFLRFTNDDVYDNISAVCEIITEKIQSLRKSPEAPPY